MVIAVLEGCFQVVELLLEVLDILFDAFTLFCDPGLDIARWTCYEPDLAVRLEAIVYWRADRSHLSYALVNVGILW